MPLYIVQRKLIRQTLWEDFICVEDETVAKNRRYFEERDPRNSRFQYRVVKLVN